MSRRHRHKARRFSKLPLTGRGPVKAQSLCRKEEKEPGRKLRPKAWGRGSPLLHTFPGLRGRRGHPGPITLVPDGPWLCRGDLQSLCGSVGTSLL